MLREQEIIKSIINDIGSERLDKYAETFNIKSLWIISEKELIVDKTFKDILEVFAKYNLSTADEILTDAYQFKSDTDMRILTYILYEHSRNGSNSVLNRAIIFCYLLYLYSSIKEKPSKILSDIIEEDIVVKKENIFYVIMCKLHIVDKPYKKFIQKDKLYILSAVSGKNLQETFKYLSEI